MLILPRAILFDMDGTITRPALDFPSLKAEMGIGERPILEALAEMSGHERKAAEAILHRHEKHAADESELNEGAEDLLAWLNQRHMPMALITRNSRASVQTVLANHGLIFDTLITREDGRFKPHPEPLLQACEKLKVAPKDAWMVGDGIYDVEAGVAAGIRSVWVSHGRDRTFQAQPWKTVTGLPDLTTILKNCLIE